MAKLWRKPSLSTNRCTNTAFILISPTPGKESPVGQDVSARHARIMDDARGAVSIGTLLQISPMEKAQAFENRVLEKLNAGKTVRSFLMTAVELLAEALDILVVQVFRKDDYAVKYAVEPLLTGTGPLGDLSVRLKLIYALGVISRHEYEDAELLMALREELNYDGEEYRFTDDEILGPFGELHCVTELPPAPTFLKPGEADESLIAMQRQRYQQIVRSTMVLSVTGLIAHISNQQPSRLSPVQK
ncbi:Mannitol repressor protein [Rahnella bruchi]